MTTPRWYMVNKMGMATLCANKADAQQEAADAQRFWPHMGPHRAVQLVEAADVEAMRAGYDAARLEIESLQARIKTMTEEHADELMVAHLDGRMRAAQVMFNGLTEEETMAAASCIGLMTEPAGEYPALPDAAGVVVERVPVGGGWVRHYQGDSYTADQMRAYVDADRAMRAAQPAGAQQPGTAYAELPDDDRDYMRKVVAVAVTMLFDGYKEDVMRVFSTSELSEFVTITAAMRGEQVEDIYRRAWDLLSLPARASHGQAPAQAAPQREAQEPVATIEHTLGGSIQYCPLGTAYKLPMGVQFNLYTEPQPSPTPQADSQPARDERDDFEKVFPLPSGCIRVGTGYASTGYSNWAAHTHVERWKGWRARAARAPADSVTAPVGGETYHLGACIVEDMLHATVMRKEPGRAGAVTVLLSEQIPVEHLQDRDVIVNATPPAQAADSVLEDAARYRWLRATTNYVTSNGERIDVRNTPEKWDAAIDAARAAQEDKSHGRDA